MYPYSNFPLARFQYCQSHCKGKVWGRGEWKKPGVLSLGEAWAGKRSWSLSPFVLWSMHHWSHSCERSCLSASWSRVLGPAVLLGLSRGLSISAATNWPKDNFQGQAFEPWIENPLFPLLPLNIFPDILQLSLEEHILKILILLLPYDLLHRTFMTHQKQPLSFCNTFLPFLEKNEGLVIQNSPLGKDKYFTLVCCITFSQNSGVSGQRSHKWINEWVDK